MFKSILKSILVFVCLSSVVFAYTTEVKQVRASHILVKTRKEAVQIQKDIASGKGTFEEYAKMYSLCPSGEKGGDLGFFSRGQMVSAFEQEAFSLPVGQVSDPVGTEFGWHLIKVTDKREFKI